MDKCYSCGGSVRVIKDQPYEYKECGLPIVLRGILQYTCEDCGETYASIPAMEKLHRVIGEIICRERKALLQPDEIKFLRKNMQLKSKELAQWLGVTPSTVSRWENGKKDIGESQDRLLRSIYLLSVSEKDHKAICDGTTNIFKELPQKRKKIKSPREISFNPQEWLLPDRDCCLT